MVCQEQSALAGVSHCTGTGRSVLCLALCCTPGHNEGREAIFLNVSWASLGFTQHTRKKHIHLSSLLSPRLGFVFKSVWQATKLAESVSWLATRSKNAVLSPPLFHPASPWIFFLLHLATVSCIYNKPLSASFSLGAGTSGSCFFIFRISLGREGAEGQPGFAFLLLLTVILPGRRGSSLLCSGLCRLMAASAVIQAIT